MTHKTGIASERRTLRACDDEKMLLIKNAIKAIRSEWENKENAFDIWEFAMKLARIELSLKLQTDYTIRRKMNKWMKFWETFVFKRRHELWGWRDWKLQTWQGVGKKMIFAWRHLWTIPIKYSQNTSWFWEIDQRETDNEC